MSPGASPRVTTVLLVAHAEDDRAIYGEYLRAAGLRVTDADNTADALALAITADVVVTGIRVPGPFDGLELVRHLRRNEPTKAKPIIVVTGLAFESETPIFRSVSSVVSMNLG